MATGEPGVARWAPSHRGHATRHDTGSLNVYEHACSLPGAISVVRGAGVPVIRPRYRGPQARVGGSDCQQNRGGGLDGCSL